MTADSKKYYRKWEIWDVDWPHEDGTSKARPALLISSDEHNLSHTYVWFIKITTQEIPEAKACIILSQEDPRVRETGLHKDCFLYPQLAKKLGKEEALKYRGMIRNRDLRETIWKQIVRLVGLLP